MEKILAYDTRIGNVTSGELEGIDFEQNIDMCILARNSDEVIVSLSDNQCTRIPSDFNGVMRKYNRRPTTIFKIFEMDKKNLGRNAIALKSGGGQMKISGIGIHIIIGLLTWKLL